MTSNNLRCIVFSFSRQYKTL